MPVTLADIARELGVSKMTVSRAINDNPLISSETRARVLEVARRMNYQPNQHARALATNRSYLIGVIVPDLMNLYFAEVMRAIESITRPAGFQLLICSSESFFFEIASTKRCASWMLVMRGMPKSAALRRMR